MIISTLNTYIIRILLGNVSNSPPAARFNTRLEFKHTANNVGEMIFYIKTIGPKIELAFKGLFFAKKQIQHLSILLRRELPYRKRILLRRSIDPVQVNQ